MAKKSKTKLIVIILIALFTLSVIILPRINVPFEYENVESNDLEILQPHGRVFVDGKYYLGTRTIPGTISVINDLNDPSSIQTIEMQETGYIEQLTYDSVNNKIYGSTLTIDGSKIISINPDDISDYKIVFNSKDIRFGVSPGIATDGTYVYIVSFTAIINIYKIRISDWTLVDENQLNILAGKNAHSMKYPGGLYLYASSQNGIFRINKDTLEFESLPFLQEVGAMFTVFTAHLDFTEKYVFVQSEVIVTPTGTISKVVRINREDFTFDLVDIANGYGAYYYGGDYIWFANGIINSLSSANPRGITRLNIETLESEFYPVLQEEDLPNGIVVDGFNVYYTTWNPTKLIKADISKKDCGCWFNIGEKCLIEDLKCHVDNILNK